MKSFAFRLESLLKLRVQEEQASQLAFAEARREEARAEAEARRFDAQLVDLDRAWSLQVLEAPIDATELVRFDAYRSMLRERSAAAQMEWRKRRDTALEASRNLERAMQKRKVLEKLKERRYSAWQQDAAQRAQAELDELGARRHGRKES